MKLWWVTTSNRFEGGCHVWAQTFYYARAIGSVVLGSPTDSTEAKEEEEHAQGKTTFSVFGRDEWGRVVRGRISPVIKFVNGEHKAAGVSWQPVPEAGEEGGGGTRRKGAAGKR